MYLERIYDEDLAQASYVIGSEAAGEAIVVDPRRDAHVYLEAARAKKLKIVAVTETHVHADYLSGSRELAAAADADLYLSAEGGPDWRYRFDHRPLHHGDVIEIGELRLEALHTPGHTPEHLSFLVTDGARGDEPGYLLTGDFVFVGDLGRPDLLDEAAGYVDTRFEGARLTRRSLLGLLKRAKDHVTIWPGHGAGSACGKSLAAVPSTTVGYERLTSWWAGLLDDEEAFVAELLSGQPDAPTYFGRMKRLNRDGPPLLGDRSPLARLEAADLAGRVNRDLILLDTRPLAEQRTGTVPGALSVPGGGSFATYAAYAIDPESDKRPVVVLARDRQHAERLRERLSYVGIDDVIGYLDDLAGLDLRPVPLQPAAEARHRKDANFLDVRAADEFARGAAPGAVRVHVGQVLARIAEVPKGRPLIVYCEGGGRAAVAASLLRNRGYADVIELTGSQGAWATEAEPAA